MAELSQAQKDLLAKPFVLGAPHGTREASHKDSKGQPL